MNEKEVLLESIRTGLFPDLKVIEVNQDMVELLIAAITALAGFFIIGRSIRNTRAK